MNEAIRDRILEAIDLLRNRKARPDITRISNFLFRRYKVSSADAKAGLEWCVANNVVLKVEYKGNISYRNAAKKKAQTRKRGPQHFTHQNQYASSKLAVNRGFMELLTNVFGELVVEEPDYLENGVPPQDIMEKILSKDSVNYTRRHAAILLVEEVQRGNLVKLENGNFILGPCDEKPKPVRKYQRAKAATSNELVQNAGAAQVKRKKQTDTGAVQVKRKKQNDTGAVQLKQKKQAAQVKQKKQTDTGTGQVKPKKQINKGAAKLKPKKKMIAKMQPSARKNKEENNMASGDDEKRTEGENQRSGRRKKAKKVFDPSDTHLPKKRGRPPIKNTIKKTKRAQVPRPESPESSKDHDSRPVSRGSSKDPDSRPNSPRFSKDLGGVCGICFTQSKRGPDDRMVACKECSYKAHYGCLENDDMVIDNLNPNTTWRCPHCKTCRYCFETSNAGDLIVCAVCADAYHATCHQPEITEKIEKGQKWLCVYCQATEEMRPDDFQAKISESFDFVKNFTKGSDKESEVSPNSPSKIESESSSPYRSPSGSPSPPGSSPNRESESPTRESDSDSSSDKDSDDGNESSDDSHSRSTSPEVHNRPPGKEIDPSIPDASKWTADDVYQYFRNILTDDEAKVFKEQEIDGRSFLLLRRIDVLSHLNLMLGPALKVYRHLTMLQVRRDDKSLYWL